MWSSRILCDCARVFQPYWQKYWMSCNRLVLPPLLHYHHQYGHLHYRHHLPLILSRDLLTRPQIYVARDPGATYRVQCLRWRIYWPRWRRCRTASCPVASVLSTYYSKYRSRAKTTSIQPTSIQKSHIIVPARVASNLHRPTRFSLLSETHKPYGFLGLCYH